MPAFRYPMPKASEITPKEVFLNRRAFMAGATATAMLPFLPRAEAASIPFTKSAFSTADEPASLDVISTYNNFYEFGTGKSDPADNAHMLTTSPWTIQVDGLVNNPGVIDMDEMMGFDMEERIYWLRCVEAWSMVIPWVGFPLKTLIDKFDVQGSAKYVAFETLVRPEEMPGQNRPILEWPYREGLRLDEAMHPLTIMAVGIYGEPMPNQNGAPIRLVVPWKYGFKSIKSIVRMSFVEEQPQTTWNMQAPQEYGFYSNVNPGVDHPRWSQKSERVIGTGLLAQRRQTEQFNGYKDLVGSLYEGMDLTKFY